MNKPVDTHMTTTNAALEFLSENAPELIGAFDTLAEANAAANALITAASDAGVGLLDAIDFPIRMALVS